MRGLGRRSKHILCLLVVAAACLLAGCTDNDGNFVATGNGNAGVPVTVRFGAIVPRADVRAHALAGVPNADQLEIALFDSLGNRIVNPSEFQVTTINPDATFSTTGAINLASTITGIKIEFTAASRPASVQFLFRQGGNVVGVGKAIIPPTGSTAVQNPPVLALNGAGPDLTPDITVVPPSLTLNPSTSSTLSVLFKQGTGDQVDITNACAYSSDGPSVANVNGSGTVTAGDAAGSTIVRVKIQGTEIQVPVTVAAVSGLAITPANPSIGQGGNIMFQALRGGNPVNGQWFLADANLGAIGLNDGSFTASTTNTGSSTVRFVESGTSEEVTTSVTVNPRSVIRVRLIPENPFVGSGSNIQFHFAVDYNTGDTEVMSEDQVSPSLTSSNPSACQIVSGSFVRCGQSGLSSTISGTCNINSQSFSVSSSTIKIADITLFGGVGTLQTRLRNAANGSHIPIGNYTNSSISGLVAVNTNFSSAYFSSALSNSTQLASNIFIAPNGSFDLLGNSIVFPPSSGAMTAMAYNELQVNQTTFPYVTCGFDSSQFFVLPVETNGHLGNPIFHGSARGPIHNIKFDNTGSYVFIGCDGVNGFDRFTINPLNAAFQNQTVVLDSANNVIDLDLQFITSNSSIAVTGSNSSLGLWNYIDGNFSLIDTHTAPPGALCSEVNFRAGRVFYACTGPSTGQVQVANVAYNPSGFMNSDSNTDTFFSLQPINIILFGSASTGVSFLDSYSEGGNFTINRDVVTGGAFLFSNSTDYDFGINATISPFDEQRY